jgi:cobalt-precorrin 5A hydrolase
VFQSHNLSLKSIKALATVNIKRDEQGLIEASKTLNCPLAFYSKEKIQQVQQRFGCQSAGTSEDWCAGVCEPCACLAGGRLIVGKTVMNGVTIAVAKEYV